MLEAALDKHFTYDYELNWDKKNHAVELAFILEVQNVAGIETVDDEGNASEEDIFLEEYVLSTTRTSLALTRKTTWSLCHLTLRRAFQPSF